MSTELKHLTDKEKVGAKLCELNKLVTKEDRKEYSKKFGPISSGNLSLYLNGTVYDLNKAIEMVKFFKKRITVRNNAIEELIK